MGAGSTAAPTPSFRPGGGLAPARCDRELVEDLFLRHEQDLGRFVAQVIGDRDRSADVLQNTFIAAVSRAASAPPENPRAWLFGLARNQALQELRSRRRLHRLLDRLRREPTRRASDPAEAAAVRDVLDRHVQPDDRLLLVLKYLHGFSTSELALVWECSPIAMRQRISRTRRRAAEALKHQDQPIEEVDDEFRGRR